ncbi:hypothetical protein D3C87_176880 [compost metagenome]
MKYAVLLLSFSLLPLTVSAQQGTFWTTECYSTDEDILQEELFQKDGRWEHTHVAYEEENCQKAYLRFQQVSKARLAGQKLDLTHVETSYTPLSEEVAEALNSVAWCGISHWRQHEKQVVTGLVCGDYKAAQAGDMTYSIFKVSSLSKTVRVFLWGKATPALDGKSEATRFQDLNERPFYLIH